MTLGLEGTIRLTECLDLGFDIDKHIGAYNRNCILSGDSWDGEVHSRRNSSDKEAEREDNCGSASEADEGAHVD